jgi:thiol-disulfide isomerase/thioredoxin
MARDLSAVRDKSAPNEELKSKIGPAAAAAVLALSAFVAGCGAEHPKSAATPSQFRVALAGAPAPLKKLYSQENQILDGGPSRFKRQLRALRGYPVVVNKWASWCGPCRVEFPFFQDLARTRGRRIAFLGVDSLDRRDDAIDFLRRFPVPYPSLFDPDGHIARLFRGDRASPATAFYDRNGSLVVTKQGQYSSKQALAGDITRYAR